MVSNKETPTDIDLAIKLYEDNIASISPCNAIFITEQIKSEYCIDLVFMKPKSQSLNQKLPKISFSSNNLIAFRKFTNEEMTKISQKTRTPSFNLQEEVKGVIRLNLSGFCE